MHIHFICRGNTFRSRLAEAYFNSKTDKYKATSSGIKADLNYDGPITWSALKILKDNNIIGQTKLVWQKTTKEKLNSSDLIVFMSNTHFNYCVKYLDYNKQNYQIWNIKDIEYIPKKTPKSLVKFVKDTEKIFKEIQLKVNRLLLKIANEKT